MLKTIMIVILILNGLHYVVSQNNTCLQLFNNISDVTTLDYYCVFMNDIEVRCIKGGILSFEENSNEYYFLRDDIHLKVAKSDVNGSVKCLELTSRIHTLKLIDGTTGSTTNNGSLVMGISYNASIPAAVLELDCQDENSGCKKIRSVRSIDIKQPTMSSPTAYWNESKMVYATFKAHDVELYVDRLYGWLRPEDLSLYLQHFHVTCLRLSGGSWGHLNVSLNTIVDLKYLLISNNRITDIYGLFSHTPHLESLALADNLLKEVPSDITKLEKLNHLDISNNPFTNYESVNEIWNLPFLTFLDLAYINMTDNMTIIETLIQKCNSKSEFKLEILNISYCEIQNLNEKSFNCLKQLTILDLSYNKMKEIPSNIVQTCQNLKELNISNNLLHVPPKLIINNNVTKIDISNNNLKNVSNIISEGYVDYLDLSMNNISYWSNETVFKSRVSNLNISLNKITVVSKHMIHTFDMLKTVDLGGNPFNCSDCLLPDFQSWIRVQCVKEKTRNLGHGEQLTCDNPRGKHIVDVKFDKSKCVDTPDYFLVVGVPVISVVLFIIISISVCCYVFRFEITYLMHLIKIRRNKNTIDPLGRYEFDAFVSYSGHDRNWVIGELLPTLESEPDEYRLCLHERDFIAGLFIMQNVISSVEASRHTIVVLSDNFVRSQWCRWELDIANHKLFEESREFLILIELERLDRSSLPRHLKFLMDTRTYLEWPENQNNERAWRRLKDALGPSIHSRNINNVKIEEEIPLQENTRL